MLKDMHSSTIAPVVMVSLSIKDVMFQLTLRITPAALMGHSPSSWVPESNFCVAFCI